MEPTMTRRTLNIVSGLMLLSALGAPAWAMDHLRLGRRVGPGGWGVARSYSKQSGEPAVRSRRAARSARPALRCAPGPAVAPKPRRVSAGRLGFAPRAG